MVLSEILKLAIDSFRASKMRFALTALGMVIGTASVILVVTIGLTGKQFILDEIQKIEHQLRRAGVRRRRRHGRGARALQRLPHPRRRKAVDEQVPGIMYSSPVLEMHDPISFGGGLVKDTLVLGVSSGLPEHPQPACPGGAVLRRDQTNRLTSSAP